MCSILIFKTKLINNLKILLTKESTILARFSFLLEVLTETLFSLLKIKAKATFSFLKVLLEEFSLIKNIL